MDGPALHSDFCEVARPLPVEKALALNSDWGERGQAGISAGMHIKRLASELHNDSYFAEPLSAFWIRSLNF